MTTYNKFRIGIALISTSIGLILPILLYMLGNGYQTSFSLYHETIASNYLFAFLILMSVGFFIGKNLYKISGILLICIAFITVEQQMAHNILAGLFFGYTGILMLLDKRFWVLSVPIFAAALSVPNYGLYPFEIISVWCISLFNILYIIRFLRVINVR